MARLQPKFFDARPDAGDLSLYTELVAEFNTQPGRHRTPYILFGCIQTERNTNREPPVSYTPSIHKLPIGESHGNGASIQRYVDRGFVVLDYWLPAVGDRPAAVHRGDAEIQSGWGLDWSKDRRDELEAIILKAKHQGDALYKLKEDKTKLSQKVADLEAKLAGKAAKNG